MRLIYICEECGRYIDEIQLAGWNETLLGFDILTPEERDDLLCLDWDRRVGTVRSICESCWSKHNPAESGRGQPVH
ncbi:MAG: DUF2757 family protein [Peptococcaceae bacterium]|nr:anti-sigma-F factor Fin family protein [Peptococcaceae bacterium]MDH7526081.1 DUF2757 family protein [Peptococcaceae bacterium]